jgi:hypothetical protein
MVLPLPWQGCYGRKPCEGLSFDPGLRCSPQSVIFSLFKLDDRVVLINSIDPFEAA